MTEKEKELAKETAARFNKGKVQWSQVDFQSLEPMVRVLEYGEKKYSRGNWMKGQSINQLVDSAMRHMVAFMDGEDNDNESGLPHIGHAMCNLMFISYNMDALDGKYDDRVKKNKKTL